MNIPKKVLKKLIAEYIGSSLFNGVHWINYTKNPSLDKIIEQINQSIIGAGDAPDKVLTLVYNQDDKTVIFNKKLTQMLAMEMFDELEKANKVKVKYTDLLDIEKSRQSEIQEICQYIEGITDPTFDIFLYKMDGPREKHIIVSDDNGKYKMIVNGFYLTEQDIEDVNYELSKIDKKIYSIEKKEMLDPFLGIRYTIQIGGADFIKD